MVMGKEYVPDRGDLIWITLNPQAGHEQAERRPAMILSPAAYNAKVGLAILCPVTTQIKGYPFEVGIPEGLGIQGVILADQVKSLDWRVRQAKSIGRIPQDTVNDVLQKLGVLLSGD